MDTTTNGTDAALRILHPVGISEIRILGVPGYQGSRYTLSGYYDHTNIDIEKLDGIGAPAIYVTLNPVLPELLLRSKNKLTKKPKHTTTDAEILRRRWILIDFDPIRPAGISSSNAEHEAARQLAIEVADWLFANGCGEVIIADSGNGFHLLLPIDLPNDEPSTQLVKRFIATIKAHFETEAIDIDRSVFNASRIVKLYGTTVRKGDPSEDRPHRRSQLVYVPKYLENGWADPTSADVLESIAAMHQEEEEPSPQSNGKPVDAERVKRCTAYIEKIDDSVEGNKGSDRMLQAACETVRFDLGQSDTWHVLDWFNRTKCKPQWSEKEIRHKIESAERKAVRGDRLKEQPTSQSDSKLKVSYNVITSAELDAGDYEVEYLIDRTLVAGQPALVAGDKKTLKTGTTIDLSIAMASGGYYLGKLKANRELRVMMMSGESGLGTIQETARRIAASGGRKLSELDNLLWSTDLPLFGHLDHMDALGELIDRQQLDVLIIDPAYLCMDGADASNLFAQGKLLRSIATICEKADVTLIILHHTRKRSRAEQFGTAGPAGSRWAPPELEDVAWAGFQEFARQWILIGRRETYEPGSNLHQMWLNVGGSAGHSALWAVDVNENFVPEFEEPVTEEGNLAGIWDRRRGWNVEIRSGHEARDEAKAAAEQKKKNEDALKLNTAKRKLWSVIKDYPDGQTFKQLREEAGLKTDICWSAIRSLEGEGNIEKCEVKKNGRPYDGYRPLKSTRK